MSFPLESCDENIPLSLSSLLKFTFRLAMVSCPFYKVKQARTSMPVKRTKELLK